jgi:NAD(P)-dependent dehydrogenase (short-subunit alcohol dehydrogenase family)
MDFSNKVVLITGASRGIGRSCAEQFAKRGAKVAVHYNSNAAAAQETLSLLAGEGHLIVQAELANPDDVRRMVETVVQHYGRIDVLVNNAGVYTDHKVAEVGYEDWLASWQQTIAVNLFGAANALYWAAHFMKQQGGGRIVNVSSRGAFRGEPDAPAYGASKAGMNSMGQSMAKALAPHNITVNTVAPGWVETDMAKEYLNNPVGADIRSQSPLNRVATPDEIAHAVMFMASDGCDYMTGAILDVNGASYLRS